LRINIKDGLRDALQNEDASTSIQSFVPCVSSLINVLGLKNNMNCCNSQWETNSVFV